MRCPTCGSGVTVHGSPEGTCSYEPTEVNALRAALTRITTAGTMSEGDPFGRAYLAAADGYSGLQAIADVGFRAADRIRDGDEPAPRACIVAGCLEPATPRARAQVPVDVLACDWHAGLLQADVSGLSLPE